MPRSKWDTGQEEFGTGKEEFGYEVTTIESALTLRETGSKTYRIISPVWDAIVYFSIKLSTKPKQVEVVRQALEIGIPMMWSASKKVIDLWSDSFTAYAECESEYLPRPPTSGFDMGSSWSKKWTGQMHDKDSAQLGALQQGLGLTQDVVFQLALICAFLRSENLPTKYLKTFGRIIRGFIQWLKGREFQIESYRHFVDKEIIRCGKSEPQGISDILDNDGQLRIEHSTSNGSVPLDSMAACH